LRFYRIRKFPSKPILAIFITAVIILSIKLLPGFRNAAFETLAKPLKIFSGAKTYFMRVEKLRVENILLKQRLSVLSIDLARMAEIEKENERLHGLLGFRKSLRYKTFAALVIGRSPADWRQTLIINKGKKDGLREHMPCATAKGFIGSIIEAGETTSKVMLITDPNSKVGVVLKNSRESGLLTGSPEGLCKVIYLSVDEEIKDGDEVVTAGFGDLVPKGLGIGNVSAVAIDKVKLYKYAIVRPFEDMNKVEEVICIDVK